MVGGEREPNRDISRRELLKSIGRGGLIVSGITLTGASGIDLCSAYMEPGDDIMPENTQRKIRDVWGAVIGAGLTAFGGMMVWDARQKAPETASIKQKSKPLLPPDTVK